MWLAGLKHLLQAGHASPSSNLGAQIESNKVLVECFYYVDGAAFSTYRNGRTGVQQEHLFNAKLCELGLIAAALYPLLNIPVGQSVSNKNNLFVPQQRKMLAAYKR